MLLTRQVTEVLSPQVALVEIVASETTRSGLLSSGRIEVTLLEFRLKKRERQPKKNRGYRWGENEGEKENPSNP